MNIIIFLALLFGLVHSGMVTLRPKAEKFIPPRLYRIFFVIVSFAFATPWLVYLVNHRYDGLILFNLQKSVYVKLLVAFIASLAFLFLYPGTFRFLEIVPIRKPTQRFYDSGIMRITRHPQLIGMSLWCLAHFIWIGSTFILATSAGLIGYHLFSAWLGDRRRLALFGKEYQKLIDQTSIIPFKAILEGKQKFKPKEFLDKAYFGIIIFICTVYYLHPAIYESFAKWQLF